MAGEKDCRDLAGLTKTIAILGAILNEDEVLIGVDD